MALNVAVSVINMKGGVGKTTIVALLCRHFAQRYRVLAIDLDPQANLSQALMGEQSYRRFLDEGSPSIVEVFHGYQPPATDATPGQLNTDAIPRTVDTWGRSRLENHPFAVRLFRQSGGCI